MEEQSIIALLREIRDDQRALGDRVDTRLKDVEDRVSAVERTIERAKGALKLVGGGLALLAAAGGLAGEWAARHVGGGK